MITLLQLVPRSIPSTRSTVGAGAAVTRGVAGDAWPTAAAGGGAAREDGDSAGDSLA